MYKPKVVHFHVFFMGYSNYYTRMEMIKIFQTLLHPLDVTVSTLYILLPTVFAMFLSCIHERWGKEVFVLMGNCFNRFILRTFFFCYSNYCVLCVDANRFIILIFTPFLVSFYSLRVLVLLWLLRVMCPCKLLYLRIWQWTFRVKLHYFAIRLTFCWDHLSLWWITFIWFISLPHYLIC